MDVLSPNGNIFNHVCNIAIKEGMMNKEPVTLEDVRVVTFIGMSSYKRQLL